MYVDTGGARKLLEEENLTICCELPKVMCWLQIFRETSQSRKVSRHKAGNYT